MKRWLVVTLVMLTGCLDPDAGFHRLRVNAVGPGTLFVEITTPGEPARTLEATVIDEQITEGDSVYLGAVPRGGTFVGWSGTNPECMGDSDIEFGPRHTADIVCTATFEASRYTVVLTAPDGGILEVTEPSGETTTCAPADSPCEVEVEGDSVTVEGVPDTAGHVTVFDPPCPAGPGESCLFDLDALDTDDDGQVSIGATFTDPTLRYTLLLDVVGGALETIDILGETTSCDPADAPCEVEVPGDVVTLAGTPDTAGYVAVFDPVCSAGPGNRCVFFLADLDTDGDRTVSIGATFVEPTPPYTVVLTIGGDGVVDVTGGVGGATSCSALDSPCEVVASGDTLTLEGRPVTAGHVTLFSPACPMGSGNRCVFDLPALDPDGDHRVLLEVTFAPGMPRVRLDACVGLTFSYEEPFGGAMFRVAADGRCEVVRNDGMVLGTFAISGGNGFGGDGSLAIAGIVAESEWLPSGDLTTLEVDGAPAERLVVPPGVVSSQDITLGFTSGMRFVVRVEGRAGEVYTRVTQTVLDASR